MKKLLTIYWEIVEKTKAWRATPTSRDPFRGAFWAVGADKYQFW